MQRFTLVAVAACAVASPAHTDTLLVPTQFATIQEAVDASRDGDVIEIEPGLYAEQVLVSGRDITLRGDPRGAMQTVLTGLDIRSILAIKNCDVDLQHLAFEKGLSAYREGPPSGAAVDVRTGSATLYRCIVRDCNGPGAIVGAPGTTLVVLESEGFNNHDWHDVTCLGSVLSASTGQAILAYGRLEVYAGYFHDNGCPGIQAIGNWQMNYSIVCGGFGDGKGCIACGYIPDGWTGIGNSFGDFQFLVGPICETYDPGALDGVTGVGPGDLGVLLAGWGNSIPPQQERPDTDLNQDGVTDAVDLGILLSHWTG